MMRRCGLVCLIAAGAALIGAVQCRAQEEVLLGDRRIVGGEPADINESPWQVALAIHGPDGSYLCGGSVVGSNWIMTAAHCLVGSANPTDVRAKTGEADYSGDDNWLEVEGVFLHERYDSKTQANDIALLKLRTIPAGKIIPMAGPKMALAPGEPLQVTGWGATAEGSTASPRLLRATVPYVDPAICNGPASYNGTIGLGMLCAGREEGGTDACQGDSGGPLVAATPDGPVLVGVVSFGQGCARRLKYGVYTRVSAYYDWARAIMSTMGN